jgi:hypothetical protein
VSNNTVAVNSTNAAVYGVRGWDSLNKKRWNVTGNKTVTASFKNTIGSNTLDDVVIQLSNSPVMVNKLASLPDPKLPKTGN